MIEWCDSNDTEHRAGEFAGWGFYWELGAIHIGRTTEMIARKAAALFVSLWLRGMSASFCGKIISGTAWFWELHERPRRIDTVSPLDLAQPFHENYERLAPNFGDQTRTTPGRRRTGHSASDALAHPERLFLSGFPEIRQLGQGEENDLLAGDGADVMMHAQHLDAGDLTGPSLPGPSVRFQSDGSALLSASPVPLQPEAT